MLKFFVSAFIICWLFAGLFEYAFGNVELLHAALIAFFATLGACVARVAAEKIFAK